MSPPRPSLHRLTPAADVLVRHLAELYDLRLSEVTELAVQRLAALPLTERQARADAAKARRPNGAQETAAATKAPSPRRVRLAPAKERRT